MDFRGRQAIFFIALLCGVTNSEPIPLNLTQLPTPGPVPLNLTSLGITGPVTLNLTGLPIPEPTPLNLTKVPIPMALPTGYHFTYFVLALQWPGAYDRECPHNGDPAFVIHGLWPQVKVRNGYPSDDPLTLPQDGQFIQKMNSIWPSITGRCDNRWFWKHEWQYHGAFSNLPSQLDYFSRTVMLTEQVERINLLRVLRENGIPESSSNLYSVSKFRSVLGRHVLGFGKIVCRDQGTMSQITISQIYLCVDPTASRFIPCPRSFNRNSRCKPQVSFLLYNSR